MNRRAPVWDDRESKTKGAVKREWDESFGEVTVADVLGVPETEIPLLLDMGRETGRVLANPRESHHASGVTWPKLFVGDLAAMLVSTIVAVAVSWNISPTGRTGGEGPRHDLVYVSIFPVCLILCLALLGLYREGGRRLRPTSFADFWTLLGAGALAVGLAVAAILGLERRTGWATPNAGEIALLMGVALIISLAARSITYYASRSRTPLRIVIVGSGMIANRIRDYLSRDNGVNVLGFVDDDPLPPTRVLGGTADLPELCRNIGVDRVLVSFSRTHPKDLMASLRELHGVVPIAIVPRYFELLTWRSMIDDICGLPIIDVAPPSLGNFDRFSKRTFDLVVSVAMLLLLSPVIVAIGIAIKVTSPGPVLFRQDRVGRHGAIFRITKFRSMRQDAEAIKEHLMTDNEVDGPIFKIKADPRVTSIGRVLRKTSLDELPQIFNVLLGQMSLVGPRPFVTAEASQIEGWAKRRFEVRPGVTGLWQVSGRNDLSYEDLERLDYLYVASWSLSWDIKILSQTPGSVINGHGAY